MSEQLCITNIGHLWGTYDISPINALRGRDLGKRAELNNGLLTV